MFKFDASSLVSKYIRKKLSSSSSLTEKDLSPIIKELKTTFLNADVNRVVVNDFLNEIKQELLSENSNPKNENVDLVVLSAIKDKLTKILGGKTTDLNLYPNKLNKVLIIGLNGSGKTTTTAKLSNYFKNKNLKVKNISLDIYRPGAYDQLKQLSDSVGISCFQTQNNDFETTIKSHIKSAESEEINCIFFDNYGLLTNDNNLLEEAQKIKKWINPTEVLLVMDAMSGQDALHDAQIFHEKLGITGLVVSKTDSQSSMGGVFSIAYMTKIPIKYMGTGEKIDDISLFHPDRVSSLILGGGDILSLVEKLENKVDQNYTNKFFKKLMKGNFDLDDLICQIREIRKIGSLKSIINMIPGNTFNKKITSIDAMESQLDTWEVIINSMTSKERKNPKLFKKQPERKVRVIKGSGKKPEELNKLLKKWDETKQRVDSLSHLVKRGGNPFSFFSGR